MLSNIIYRFSMRTLVIYTFLPFFTFLGFTLLEVS
jgi:hypothetical protein